MPKIPRQVMDLTGQTYGQLLVLAYAGRKNNRTYWRCKCLACGSVRDYQASNLRGGFSTQCNYCPAKRKQRKRAPAGYHSWKRILRTSQVCQRWLSFEKFIADMGEPPKGKPFLVRMDPTEPYKPSNCKWSAFITATLLTHNGRTMSISDWARELNMSKQALHLRLKKMPVHEALSKPVRKQ